MGNKAAKSSTAADAKALVDDAIATHPVVIFSKTFCPYCQSAKSDIARAGAAVAGFKPPKVFELDRIGALGRAVQAYLTEVTGRFTVPNVFIGGRSVGGGDEVAGFARRNVLKQMLTQAPDRIVPRNGVVEKEQESVKDFVDRVVEEHPVVVFSKSWCPYCKAAKAQLAKVAPEVPGWEAAKVFEMDTMGERGAEMQAYLAEKTGRSTVPNVFIAGKSVGGNDDVASLASRGELIRVISSAVRKDSDVPAAAAVREKTPETPEDIVESAIKQHPVVVFSKTWCPYCVSAKAHLSKAAPQVDSWEGSKVFELNDMGELGPQIQAYLMQKTGRRTVPNVFIGGTSVGGGDDVGRYAANGELLRMISEAVKTKPMEEKEHAVNSPADVTAMDDTPSAPAPTYKDIVFGAGCFWGVELAFQRVVGVIKTQVGYSNGRVPRVTYEAVCSGLTGSAEVVRVTYDPAVVSLTELLKVWESRHDPTSINKQGNDIGTQYRSAVFYNDAEQAAEIEKWKTKASGRLSRPIASEIAPVSNYCPAEEYHQRYLEKKGQSGAKGASQRIKCYG